MTADGATLFSAAQRAALAQWLGHLKALDGAAANTVSAYAADVSRYLDFLTRHRGGTEGIGAILAVPQSDLRSWMAHERTRGLGPRSMARALSAVKGFTGWLAEREGVDATAILSARGPKYRRKLPRPLSEDGARDMIDTVTAQATEDWIAARDAAVLTLLYGCGLRISEALGLTGAAHPLPATLRITGKGAKTRIVPVIPAAREAVARYVALAPYDLAPGEPLFRGAQGRPAQPAHHRPRDGNRADGAWPSRDGHAPRAAPFLRHASSVGGRRSAIDPGTSGPRLAFHHPGLHGGRCRPADGGLRKGSSACLKRCAQAAFR